LTFFNWRRRNLKGYEWKQKYMNKATETKSKTPIDQVTLSYRDWIGGVSVTATLIISMMYFWFSIKQELGLLKLEKNYIQQELNEHETRLDRLEQKGKR
jgi:type III secretory pathway component EscU